MSGTGTSSRTRALPYSCIRAAFMSASFPALVRKVSSSGSLSGGISCCRSAQSLYWHERRSTLVLDQEHQEFRRIGTACVPVNDMNIVRSFIEGLSWCQCYLLSTLQLHHDGALQYVYKRMCIVSVDRARPAGRMLYCDHQNFPAGILRKIFRHERRDLRLLSHRRAAHEA